MTSLSPEQQQALQSDGAETLVIAAAGSGKTSLLIERLFWALEQPGGGEVIALTFTERAAREMEKRALRRAKTPPQRKALAERARLTTIDGFCLSLLHDYPLSADWPGQRLVPPEDLEWFIRANFFATDLPPLRAAEALELKEIEEATVGACEFLRLRPMALMNSGLDGNAYFAARNAIVEARVRGDFVRQLEAAIAIFSDEPKLKHFVAPAASDLERDPAAVATHVVSQIHGQRLTPDGTLARDRLRAFVDTADAIFTSPHPGRHAALVEIVARATALLGRYRHWKVAREAFDFVDLEQRALEMLHDPSCRDDVQARLGHLLIDEVQDTNPLQEELLGIVGAEAKVFRVGDPRQAIYGFRDAQIDGVLKKKAALDPGSVLELTLNYRSRSGILAVANRFWSEVGTIETQPMRAPDSAPVSAASEESPAKGEVVLHLVDKKASPQKADQVARVCGLVRQLMPKSADGQEGIAILCRTTADADLIFTALQSEGVSAHTRRRRRLSLSPLCDDILSLLYALEAPDDDLSLFALMRSGIFGASSEEVFALHSLARSESAVTALERASLSPRAARGRQAYQYCLGQRSAKTATLVAGFLHHAEVALPPYSELLTRIAAMDELSLSVSEIAQRLFASVVDEEVGDPSGVAVLTIHAAKGLEWDTVVIPFLERPLLRRDSGVFVRAPEDAVTLAGPWPADGVLQALLISTKEQRRAEEHRLFYVAMTRARSALHFVATRNKTKLAGPAREQNSLLNILRQLYDVTEGEEVRLSPDTSR